MKKYFIVEQTSILKPSIDSGHLCFIVSGGEWILTHFTHPCDEIDFRCPDWNSQYPTLSSLFTFRSYHSCVVTFIWLCLHHWIWDAITLGRFIVCGSNGVVGQLYILRDFGSHHGKLVCYVLPCYVPLIDTCAMCYVILHCFELFE